MSLKIEIDPHKKYPQSSSDQLMAACGVLPHWLSRMEHPSLKERLLTGYPFYSGEIKGGTLSADGVYSYPGDSGLFALVSFEAEDEVCFIFEYGIIGVFNKKDKTTWVTRMD